MRIIISTFFSLFREMEVPPEAFNDIIKELEAHPIEMNYYRSKSGRGRSQAFGLVNRRSLPPDYCRMCWRRPYLYKLLLDFAEKYVPIPFTSITLNQNYRADRHYDKGNKGNSFLIAFGDYEGGELEIHEPTYPGSLFAKEGGTITHDVKYKGIVDDFSKLLHSVKMFYGKRYSLVFYTLDTKRFGEYNLPKPSVKQENGKYIFYRGEEPIYKYVGLPHPLKKNKIDDQNSQKK